MHDKVQITITFSDVFVTPLKMPVWVLLGAKKPTLFESLFRYVAGFNKSISAEYHPTVQAFSALTIYETFNPKYST